jgi:transposase-like protein
MDACPKCTHQHVVKAGKARGKQRWLCRGCGYQWTRTTPRRRPLWQKSLAVFR